MKAWINNKEFEFQEGETILHAAKRLGIFIPTLCAYLPLNHTPGTCRVCLVEVTDDRGRGQIVTACTTPLTNGMRVQTRTKRIREMQRWQVAWIFSDHDQDCASCSRHGNCELQDVALYVGLQHNSCNGRFTEKRPLDWSANGLVRDANKCIRCYRCVEVCRQVQGVSALTMDNIGNECGVGIAGAKLWADSAKCVQCGQCSLVCPTGALSEKDQTEVALDWFSDPEIKTVVAFAPAVRVTLGDAFQAAPGTNLEKRIVTALKQLGADYVCDINWAADVTIMEEGTELLERLNDGGTLPMMTSCCPGWVNFVEKVHPEIIPNLSTTRSPQAIFGSLAKTWFAREHGINPDKLRFISIMPCTAKKGEALRPTLARADMGPDVDAVLTVRELAKLMRRCGTHLKFCDEAHYDNDLFASYSGAGAIFGTTGGVMEAAVRTAYALTHNGKSLDPIVYQPVRGMDGVKEATADLGELGTIRIAVVHGLARTQALLDRMSRGEAVYDFVEVMACPGGCVAGGGTPRKKNNYQPFLKERQNALYRIDAEAAVRESHKNPQVIAMYADHLGQPGSAIAHELLHCEYVSKKRDREAPDVRKLWLKLSNRYTPESKKR